jgi:hypothetical protein
LRARVIRKLNCRRSTILEKSQKYWVYPEPNHKKYQDISLVFLSLGELLGAKPVDGLRLSQSLWANLENLLCSAPHVLGTAEFFLSAVGALLQGKEGDDLPLVNWTLTLRG